MLFNERLRELCAKTRALEALSLCVLCATHREHFIKCPSVAGRGLWCVPVGTHLQWGTVPATEAEIGLSPAYRGRGLRAFDKLEYYFAEKLLKGAINEKCNHKYTIY